MIRHALAAVIEVAALHYVASNRGRWCPRPCAGKAEELLIMTEDVARGLQPRVVARIVQWALVGVLIAFGLLSVPSFMRQLSNIVSLNDDVGYYDSYILYDVLQFQQTGIIY